MENMIIILDGSFTDLKCENAEGTQKGFGNLP
jgi:hypothetical protein